MNKGMTKMFGEQPLALPGSANNSSFFLVFYSLTSFRQEKSLISRLHER